MGDSIAGTLALPALGSSTMGAGLPLVDLQWVVIAAAVPYAALLAAAGRLADAVGRRRMLLIGLTLFAMGAIGAVIAPTLPVLLVARLLQGVAAAAVIPASLGLLLAEISPERRAAAIGVWSAASGLGGVILHSGGGWLAETFGWHALFAPSAILGVLLVAVATALPHPSAGRGPIPDLVGTALLLAGIAALVLAVTKSPVWGWQSATTLTLIVGGVVLMVGAGWRSKHHLVPAIEIALWRQPAFALAGLISFIYGMASFSLLAVTPVVLREVWQMGLSGIGLATAPISGGVLVASLVAGRVVRRYGSRPVIYCGVLLSGAASMWLISGVAQGQFSPTLWVSGTAVLGLGFGAISTAVSEATLGAGAYRYASAVGASMTARQIGGAVGVAAAVAILDRPFLPGPLPGYSSVLTVLIALMATAGVLALFIRPTRPVAACIPRPSSPGLQRRPALSPISALTIPSPMFTAFSPLFAPLIEGPDQPRTTLRDMYKAAANVVAAADWLLAQPTSPAGQQDAPRGASSRS
ncbi:MFS transporter [Streptosporangium lutulentum]|uniref:MFS family permease n=1 Tax=Streptosporangium lutulentum TaxID=1461250 RepID=A0ABT9QUM0_9ACTN|nr:MFS transporter [Streptosporangium lutulentum]MDP9850457.1 MFS family permease [Streptosporangium lutulentum]